MKYVEIETDDLYDVAFYFMFGAIILEITGSTLMASFLLLVPEDVIEYKNNNGMVKYSNYKKARQKVKQMIKERQNKGGFYLGDIVDVKRGK